MKIKELAPAALPFSSWGSVELAVNGLCRPMARFALEPKDVAQIEVVAPRQRFAESGLETPWRTDDHLDGMGE